MTLARITSPPAAASARLGHSQSPEHVRTSRRRSSPGNEQGAGRILRPGAFLVVTDLLEQGVPLEDVQTLVGHSQPQTTALHDRRVRVTDAAGGLAGRAGWRPHSLSFPTPNISSTLPILLVTESYRTP